MIGYSDSAKDAGRMAAAWAQYKAQVTLFNDVTDVVTYLQISVGTKCVVFYVFTKILKIGQKRLVVKVVI